MQEDLVKQKDALTQERINLEVARNDMKLKQRALETLRANYV